MPKGRLQFCCFCARRWFVAAANADGTPQPRAAHSLPISVVSSLQAAGRPPLPLASSAVQLRLMPLTAQRLHVFRRGHPEQRRRTRAGIFNVPLTVRSDIQIMLAAFACRPAGAAAGGCNAHGLPLRPTRMAEAGTCRKLPSSTLVIVSGRLRRWGACAGWPRPRCSS